MKQARRRQPCLTQLSVAIWVLECLQDTVGIQCVVLCNFFAEPWASGRCWSLSSCANWSSATCSWSAGSLSTWSRSVLCLCGCSISRWPAGSTSDWATASAAVSRSPLGFTSTLDECGYTWTCAPKGFLNNWIMCALVVTEMVAALEWWSGTECTLYTDPESYQLYGKENAIVVLNHRFEMDFLCGWTLCERFGVLGVRTRARWPFMVSLQAFFF